MTINKRKFSLNTGTFLKFNKFCSRKAFLIILFVTFREFFVAPGVKFLKFLFWILPPIVLHLKHCFGYCDFMTWVFYFKKITLFFYFLPEKKTKTALEQDISTKKYFTPSFFPLDSKNKSWGYKIKHPKQWMRWIKNKNSKKNFK